MTLDMAWYDWVGVAGAMVTLIAFWLLQARRLSGIGIPYQLLNLFGAAGILISLLGEFNFSVFLLEGVWLLISGYGILRSLRARNDLMRGG